MLEDSLASTAPDERAAPPAARLAPAITPANPHFLSEAYWSQRHRIAASGARICALADAIGHPVDLWPHQWVSLMVFALAYEPDLILELGRGYGNSTCAFLEVASAPGRKPCRVVSVCRSREWVASRAAIEPLVPRGWLERLTAIESDLCAIDYAPLLAGAGRVLVFWDAHGFEVADRVLTHILPLLESRESAVVMHDIRDARYLAPSTAPYGEQPLWRGESYAGTGLRLGRFDADVAQVVSALDFTSRNRLTLFSADHDLATGFRARPDRFAVLRSALGARLFDVTPRWHWFTLDEHSDRKTFPRPATHDPAPTGAAASDPAAGDGAPRSPFELDADEARERIGRMLDRPAIPVAELCAALDAVAELLKPPDAARRRDSLAAQPCEAALPLATILLEGARRCGDAALATHLEAILAALLRAARDNAAGAPMASRGGLDPRAERLAALAEDDLAREIAALSREEVVDLFRKDAWLANYALNTWEYATGRAALTTYPWNVHLPIADVCNAACTFCNSWIRGKRWLEMEELERFAPVLRHARLLGLEGHGEPLIHPQFEAIASRMAELVDPRCSTYLITNGVHLEKRLDALRRVNVRTFNVSLNAATPATHDAVMGLGEKAFDRVLAGVRRLLEIRDTADPGLHVNLSLVVLQQNVHEVADFVRLGNELGVTNLYVRTLMPVGSLVPGLNYQTLPPSLHPAYALHRDRALQAIAASRVNVLASPETWDAPTLGPEAQEQLRRNPPQLVSRLEARTDEALHERYARASARRTRGCALAGVTPPAGTEDENAFGRTPPFSCKFVYQNLNLNDFNFQMVPCCYMVAVPGFEPTHYDGTFDFFEVWNSPAMLELRRRLVHGPLFGNCMRCPPKL